MTRTQVLQEIRRMRFEEACGGWQERRLTQEEADRLMGVCERTFQRYVDRYEDEGLDGLVDKRSGPKSRRAVRRRDCAGLHGVAITSHGRGVPPPDVGFGDEGHDGKAGVLRRVRLHLVDDLRLHVQETGGVRLLDLAVVDDLHVGFGVVVVVEPRLHVGKTNDALRSRAPRPGNRCCPAVADPQAGGHLDRDAWVDDWTGASCRRVFPYTSTSWPASSARVVPAR